ncbi:uncharacterized protein LOC141620358 [Silene latifolia]|uniref:uncharacterized protein LOC141620358 n=1 Tax=Silene latifolia TaxID=37657 RepID=UPI003D776376
MRMKELATINEVWADDDEYEYLNEHYLVKANIKYLGIPIQPGRLTKADCNVLLEKIVSKIRGIGARKLSYAGRLVLINSVLNTLHNYWASIFLIPKGVVKRIEGICETFSVWGSIITGAPLVAWHNVCCSKEEGGLGIKDAGVWNIASVGKLVNWIYEKADRVKDLLVGGYQDNCWAGSVGAYTVSAGYHWLQDTHPPVLWYQDVWDPWVVPKHAFVGWLIHRATLNTRSKLFKLGLSVTANCVLCEIKEEIHAHLFWECVYSSQVIAGLEHWLQLKIITPPGSMSKLQRRICRVVKMAAWYTLWMQRNTARIELTLCRPENLVHQIQHMVHGRIIGKLKDYVMPRDCTWLSKINIRCQFCT